MQFFLNNNSFVLHEIVILSRNMGGLAFKHLITIIDTAKESGIQKEKLPDTMTLP